jgi:hypothetical protein
MGDEEIPASTRSAAVASGCFLVLGATCLLLLAAILWNPGCRIAGRARAAECKQNLHTIQLALERYQIDHDELFPAALGELLSLGYLPCLPANPYDRQPRGPMPEVPIGAYTPGGVTYIPLRASAAEGMLPGQVSGAVTDYKLLTYGPKRDVKGGEYWSSDRLPGDASRRIPWDYVLFTLDGGYPGKRSGN